MSEIIEIQLINPKKRLITYEDGSKKVFPITQIKTRDEALELCKSYTKKRLVEDEAYENLHKFKGDRSLVRLRNYEVEYYLHFVSKGEYFGILELCPFNGYNYMGITGEDLTKTRFELPND